MYYNRYLNKDILKVLDKSVIICVNRALNTKSLTYTIKLTLEVYYAFAMHKWFYHNTIFHLAIPFKNKKNTNVTLAHTSVTSAFSSITSALVSVTSAMVSVTVVFLSNIGAKTSINLRIGFGLKASTNINKAIANKYFKYNNTTSV